MHPTIVKGGVKGSAMTLPYGPARVTRGVLAFVNASGTQC